MKLKRAYFMTVIGGVLCLDMRATQTRATFQPSTRLIMGSCNTPVIALTDTSWSKYLPVPSFFCASDV